MFDDGLPERWRASSGRSMLAEALSPSLSPESGKSIGGRRSIGEVEKGRSVPVRMSANSNSIRQECRGTSRERHTKDEGGDRASSNVSLGAKEVRQQQ